MKGQNYDEMLKQAQAGNLDAMRAFLEYVYETGVKAVADDGTAKAHMVRFAQALMDENDPMGFYYMATFYENGVVLPEDGEEAARLYIKAGEHGAAFGYEYAGQLYYAGELVKQDYGRALELFEMSGEEMQPETIYILGDMYRLGLGTELSADDAFTHYTYAIMGFRKILENEELPEDHQAYLCSMLARAEFHVAKALIKGDTEMGTDLEEAEGLLKDAAALTEHEYEESVLYGVTKGMIDGALLEIQKVNKTLTGLQMVKAYRAHPEDFLPMMDFTEPVPARDEYGGANIGWNAGLLEENRPFFAECWAIDQVTVLTIYVSADGIEDISPEELEKMVQESGYYSYVEPGHKASVKTITNNKGETFFALDITVGIDEDPSWINGGEIYGWAVLNKYNRT